MNYFVETENIALDYSEDRILKDIPPYRITTYDKNGHFDSEFFLSEEQINDLVNGLKNQ